MVVFKCKMCGGTLEINSNETVAACEYCGMRQTLPKLDDDRRSNLYDRANHFRRNNEFDKAMGIYEQILNEDNTDAEAYWSLVLCRYGIEYVEDPSSHKRIPTVNRAQYTSIFEDDNYKSALRYADGAQSHIYEDEAKSINEIQKDILAISQKEDPFDVFICYKETDNNGRRTPDSVLANDLYHQLTIEEFKVFFSRVTLEDKIGSAYEPYIFAALNSAKVMVVLGTRPEFFKAPWVRNEWSRYLALIKQGQKKALIPAYKDMDPYDLPEEFAHLQAQDMSRLGFMQDLIRGIKKILQTDEQRATVIKEMVVSDSGVNIGSLLRRAAIFREDGDWDSADEYCERVLDIDPENAQAYLGKLMAELCVENQEGLRDLAEPFDDRNNYQKVVRFADDKLKKELTDYIEYINIRNENARLTDIYNCAKDAMNTADSEEEYKKVARLFESIIDYKDSAVLVKECCEKAEEAKYAHLEKLYNRAKDTMNTARSEHTYKEAARLFEAINDYEDSSTLAQECYEKAETARKDGILSLAQSKMDTKVVINYETAIKLLESITGWKDADERAYACKMELKEIKAKAEEIKRIEKRNKKIVIFATLILCAFLALIIELNTVIIPNYRYNNAIALMDAGKNDEAYELFVKLSDYKEAAERAKEINFIATYGQEVFDRFGFVEEGAYIFFGSYEQDKDPLNGKEDIEWIVLEVKEGKVLVISKYVLNCQPYTEKKDYSNLTWETSTLRDWLNNGFLNTAFSDEEKEMIPTVTVPADKNPNYNIDPGNATQDRVFLLSITEANKYFGSDSERVWGGTAYAESRGQCYSWWLRSPGSKQYRAAVAYYSYGRVEEGDERVNYLHGVRPVLWIDLNS